MSDRLGKEAEIEIWTENKEGRGDLKGKKQREI